MQLLLILLSILITINNNNNKNNNKQITITIYYISGSLDQNFNKLFDKIYYIDVEVKLGKLLLFVN